MASTHTWGGVNYADAFNTGMTITGIGLLLLGAGILAGVDKVGFGRAGSRSRKEACKSGHPRHFGGDVFFLRMMRFGVTGFSIGWMMSSCQGGSSRSFALM
jgi:hypothetical protein